MRRRSLDFRSRSMITRTDFNLVLWLTLCAFLAFLFLFLFFNSSRSLTSSHATIKIYDKIPFHWESFNVTKDMVSLNSITRKLSDQINLAKGFIAIAEDNDNFELARDLTAQLHVTQALLSDSATRSDPLTMDEAEQAIGNMAFLIYHANQLNYDVATIIMKMQENFENLQEQVHSITEKSLKHGQVAAEEIPTSLYCLGVRLTQEWYTNPKLHEKEKKNVKFPTKLVDNNLNHFCVFSDNILATSVVVNSTSLNSNDPKRVVFHIVTDEVNYASMKAWFSMNIYHGVTVEVQNFEDFSWLDASYVPVLRQLQDLETQNYYFSGNKVDTKTPIKYRNPKYLSMLNHLRFYIPEVFPNLLKVVFLDDDVVVQKDLSPLFKVDLNGNVNGAIETCMETFHRFHKYLNYSHPLIREHYDPDACGWAFGMNVFDLVEWRRKNVTGIYHYWQDKNIDRTLWKLGTLPPGLLTFYGLTEPLDPRWHVLGLGYTTVDSRLIEEGAVLHFNGNSKPWLRIGLGKYRTLWNRYIDYSHPRLQQCDVH